MLKVNARTSKTMDADAVRVSRAFKASHTGKIIARQELITLFTESSPTYDNIVESHDVPKTQNPIAA